MNIKLNQRVENLKHNGVDIVLLNTHYCVTFRDTEKSELHETLNRAVLAGERAVEDMSPFK